MLALTLDRIRLDADQPRLYLPADLREAFCAGRMRAEEVMLALLRRASEGDLEAQGYVNSIQDLAESIEQDGLLEPVAVYPDDERGSIIYRLLWGERRFWALVYLAARQGENEPTISAMTYSPNDDIQTVRRRQWAENARREDVPPIRMALLVASAHQRNLERAQVNAAHYARALADEIGEKAEDMKPAGLALAMTARETAAVLGRPLARRTIYLCLQIAGRLTPRTQELASAWRFTFRELLALSSLEGAEQERKAEEMARRAAAIRESGEPPPPPKSTGRPSRAEAWSRACARTVALLESDTPRRLREMNGIELQTVLQADRDLLEAIQAHMERVQAAIGRG